MPRIILKGGSSTSPPKQMEDRRLAMSNWDLEEAINNEREASQDLNNSVRSLAEKFDDLETTISNLTRNMMELSESLEKMRRSFDAKD